MKRNDSLSSMKERFKIIEIITYLSHKRLHALSCRDFTHVYRKAFTVSVSNAIIHCLIIYCCKFYKKWCVFHLDKIGQMWQRQMWFSFFFFFKEWNGFSANAGVSERLLYYLSLAAAVIVSIGSNLIVNVKDRAWQPQTR